jgi:hypothetical protein
MIVLGPNKSRTLIQKPRVPPWPKSNSVPKHRARKFSCFPLNKREKACRIVQRNLLRSVVVLPLSVTQDSHHPVTRLTHSVPSPSPKSSRRLALAILMPMSISSNFTSLNVSLRSSSLRLASRTAAKDTSSGLARSTFSKSVMARSMLHRCIARFLSWVSSISTWESCFPDIPGRSGRAFLPLPIVGVVVFDARLGRLGVSSLRENVRARGVDEGVAWGVESLDELVAARWRGVEGTHSSFSIRWTGRLRERMDSFGRSAK